MTRSERITDRNIFRVYRATFALGLAYGMAISLIAIFLDRRGFAKSDIGTLAAWFAAGIVALSLPMATLIRRFSAKFTLVAALWGYALTVTAMPHLDSYWAIAGVRLIDGACSVGVWISSETILLKRAGAKHKAYVTSLYAVTVALGYLAGPLAARGLVLFAPLEWGFTVAGVIAALAGIYVARRLDRDIEAPRVTVALRRDEPQLASAPRLDIAMELASSQHLDISAAHGASAGILAPAATHASPAAVMPIAKTFGEILWSIKTCCYATFAYGYFQASVVLFLPLYLMEQKGVLAEQTILIPAFFAAGMLAFANFGGRLGDSLGHLGMMRLLAIIGTGTILGFVYLGSFWLMAVAVAVAGATLATISPLSLALQGVIVAKEDYARSNALYNAFYAAGMLLGPPVSSALFVRFGGAVMLYHLAALWAGFAAFALLYARDDPAAAKSTAVADASDEAECVEPV